MNVMMITSLNSYTTSMKMQMKWQQKKTSGDYTADGAMTIEERLRKEAQETTGGLLGGKSKVSLSQVQTKLMSGKKLSSEEMDYLRENNPDLYKKAKAIEMEREAYEQELKQCKTKEDVQRVKLAHATAAMARVKDIESNPNIPEGQKLGLIMEQLFKTKALGEVERKFVQSSDYKRLPTEEEERQAQEDLKEAQEAEQGIEDKTDDTSQEVAKDIAAEKNMDEAVRDDIPSAEEAGSTVSTDHKKTAESPKAASMGTSPYQKEAKAVLTKTRKTRAQAEVTPEARKVKRAKAQAAYTKTPNVAKTAGSIIDLKK